MSTAEPPLVDVKVTNPVTYLRRWWQKVIGNEGMSISVKIHPLTFIAAVVAVFSIGRYSINIPFLNYSTVGSPTPTPKSQEAWKETAFVGTLHFSTVANRYFLQVTSSSEALTLQVPPEIDLKSMIGKRIFALGSYNKSTKVLIVVDARDMEILSKTPIPLPTFEVISTSIPSPSPISNSDLDTPLPVDTIVPTN